MSCSKIMVVAGEVSGDLHGAQLAISLKSMAPELHICGMGGREMASAGVEILCDISKLAVMGIVEVLGRLLDIRRAMRTLEQQFLDNPPMLLILIDYPGFNMILAKKASRLGIPVMYYISPKVWAWREGRVKTIKRFVDRMAVILPFEKEYYRKHGMDVDFVGNPLLDSVITSMNKDKFRIKNNIDQNITVVGVLPGSRKQEVVRLLPVFLEAANRLAVIQRPMVFLIPLAPGLSLHDLEANGLSKFKNLDVRVITDDRYDMMAACDAAIAASGTVTLELAILNVPMVVAYRFSPFTYHIGRRLVKVKYFSLVNLVANEEVVPELLQNEASPENIDRNIQPLLFDEKARTLMRQKLRDVLGKLGKPGASVRAAKLALRMIEQKSNCHQRE